MSAGKCFATFGRSNENLGGKQCQELEKMPVTLPSGVDVKVESGLVTVKGPKGELQQAINKDMIIKIDDGVFDSRQTIGIERT